MKQLKYVNAIIISLLIISLAILTSCKSISPTKAKSEEPSIKDDTTTEEQEVTESEETSNEADTSNTPSYVNLVDDTNFSFSDVKDHVLIIDFWAPWCPPCKAEIPSFIELYTKYKDKKFAVIGVAVSTTEDDVKAFIKQAKVNYPVIMGTGELVAEYELIMGQNITAIPTTLVIDRNGKIVSVHVGMADKSVFESDILKLF